MCDGAVKSSRYTHHGLEAVYSIGFGVCDLLLVGKGQF